MYLALKEIKHEKVRYSLIIAMVVLISYLVFILTSLALGLAPAKILMRSKVGILSGSP